MHERACMQVQKLKVDMESAMLEMDQILKSNELSIALVAAIPALIVAGAVTMLIVRWLTPRPPDPVFEALPCRCVPFHVSAACLQFAVASVMMDSGGLARRSLARTG